MMLQQALVFVRREPVLGDDLRRDRRLVRQLDGRVLLGGVVTKNSRKRIDQALEQALPSVPPNIGSVAFSGCGIRPITVLVSLKTPAMLLIEPLGLPVPSTVPSGAQ